MLLQPPTARAHPTRRVSPLSYDAAVIPAYFESPDDQPLCATCVHADETMPSSFDQPLARCGAGVVDLDQSQRKCFSYDGHRAAIVSFEWEAPQVQRAACNEHG